MDKQPSHLSKESEGIIILGYGGHAKSIADSVLKAKKYHIVGYTDRHDCHNAFAYLGTDSVLLPRPSASFSSIVNV